MIEVSVVIPTYNRRRILKRALQHLDEQRIGRSSFEVVIVDDGSSDGTSQMIKEIKVNFKLKYFYQEKRGIGAARNRGIEEARGDLIIFLDSDILASEDLVGEHLKSHQGNDKIIVQGPVILTHDLENPSQAKKTIFDTYQAFFATGNSSVKKKYLREAGKFDEGFDEYGWEDFDLGLRLKKLGLKSERNQKAIGYHYKRDFLKDLESLCRKERERGHMAIRFYRKYPTFKVKAQIMLGEPFFFLDRLLSLGNWQEEAARRFLKLSEDQGHQILLALLVKIITNHYYFQGMKERLRE